MTRPLRSAGLDAVLRQLPSDWPLTGGAIAIVGRDGVREQHVFGHADARRASPLGEEHLFEIGSISKVATAMVLVGLAEEGLYELDTPVIELLPWFRVGGDAGAVTVRHLLNHTAGLVAGLDALPDDDAQAWAVRETQLGTPPGTFFHYSNIGYVLAGRVAAAATGTPFAELVTRRVLEPAGMSRSAAAVTDAVRASLAEGTTPQRGDRPWLPGDPLAPATWLQSAGADGNIVAPIGDLARLCRLILGRGGIDGGRLVSASGFAKMTGLLAPDGEDVLHGPGMPPPVSSRYGLGVNVEQHRDRTVLTHGGGMVGYATFLLADMEAGVGVVVATNADGDSRVAEALARMAHASLTGGTDMIRLDPAAWRAGAERSAERPRAIARKMTGRFVADDGSGRSIEVFAEPDPDGRRLRLRSGRETAALHWTWGPRIVTAHTDFRDAPLGFSARDGEPVWTWLDVSFVAETAAGTATGGQPTERPEPQEQALIGRYRSYTPWYPELRVLRRGGRLLLVGMGGVEAPSEDEELVPLGDGCYRIGRDPRLPERLRCGPVVDGVARWVDRDGCRYSRSSLPEVPR